MASVGRCICSYHQEQIKESLNAHWSFFANTYREIAIKALTNIKKLSSHPSASHSSPQSKPGDKEGKIFSNDLLNDFRAYIRFKFSSRDGQKLGQPAMLGSARHWGQSAMFGLKQEHFCTSHPKTDIGILAFLLAISLCFNSPFHRGMTLPRGSIFSLFPFLACALASYVLHLWCLDFVSPLASVSNTLFVEKMNILHASKETE